MQLSSLRDFLHVLIRVDLLFVILISVPVQVQYSPVCAPVRIQLPFIKINGNAAEPGQVFEDMQPGAECGSQKSR